MSIQNKIEAFIEMCPVIFLHHQIDHYTKRIAEDDITEVRLKENFNTIKRMPFRYYYKPETIFDGEKITETEFNWALSEAIMKIAGVEVSKSQPLSIAV